MSNDSNEALAAIRFALETDDGLGFLRAWMQGDVAGVRRQWPDAPDAVFGEAVPSRSDGLCVIQCEQSAADFGWGAQASVPRLATDVPEDFAVKALERFLARRGVPRDEALAFVRLATPRLESASMLDRLSDKELGNIMAWSHHQPREGNGSVELLRWPGWDCLLTRLDPLFERFVKARPAPCSASHAQEERGS